MATSKTSIANMALIKLGEKTVTDITADSPTARACNAIYDQVLDEALTKGPEKGWKFARHRQADVAVSGDDPAFDFEYQFEIPSEPFCLRMVAVKVGDVELTDWERQGDYILTSEEDEEVDMLYISRETDAGKFPPHFVTVLYTMMAAQLAYRLKESSKHYERITMELEQVVLPRAIAMDEQERYVQEESTSWVNIGRSVDTLE
jgi:hypothetical protein